MYGLRGSYSYGSSGMHVKSKAQEGVNRDVYKSVLSGVSLFQSASLRFSDDQIEGIGKQQYIKILSLCIVSSRGSPVKGSIDKLPLASSTTYLSIPVFEDAEIIILCAAFFLSTKTVTVHVEVSRSCGFSLLSVKADIQGEKITLESSTRADSI